MSRGMFHASAARFCNPFEVPRRIEQAVRMVYPDAGHTPLAEEAFEQLMNRGKDVAVFHAQPCEPVDVEEPAIVDFVRRGPPIRQPIDLFFEQIVKPIERARLSRGAVERPNGGLNMLENLRRARRQLAQTILRDDALSMTLGDSLG